MKLFAKIEKEESFHHNFDDYKTQKEESEVSIRIERHEEYVPRVDLVKATKAIGMILIASAIMVLMFYILIILQQTLLDPVMLETIMNETGLVG